MLFDAVADLLGAAAWHETKNRGAIRRLFKRDDNAPQFVVPWPLLELNTAERFGVVTDWIPMGDAPPPLPPKPTPAPRLRGIGPGEIRLLDGPEHIEIVYGDTGAKVETCRSHHAEPLAGLVAAAAGSASHPIELLARWFAARDLGRHGPGRVLMPAAMPHGADGVWHRGLRAVRKALFEGTAPRGSTWAVADGLTGTAPGFGASTDEALVQWRDAVVARPPWPKDEKAPEPPPDVPPGAMLLVGPSPDVPLPGRVAENVPAVLVPIGREPDAPPAFGSWQALLGTTGATSFAACKRKREGFVLIGQRVLGAVDFTGLAAEMDRVDVEVEMHTREAYANAPGGVRRWPWRTTTYRVLEGGRLAMRGSSEQPEWHAGDLDGDVVADAVVRQVRVECGEDGGEA